MPVPNLFAVTTPVVPSRNLTSTSPGTTSSACEELRACGISWSCAGLEGVSEHAASAASASMPSAGVRKRDIDLSCKAGDGVNAAPCGKVVPAGGTLVRGARQEGNGGAIPGSRQKPAESLEFWKIS